MLCNALLEHGLSGLVIFDINLATEAADRLVALRSNYPAARIEVLAVDVTDAAAVSAAVDKVVTLIGPVNILPLLRGRGRSRARAGPTPGGPLNRHGGQHHGLLLLPLQAVARSMVRSGTGGSIVLVGSISARAVNFPQPQVHYNVSKAAVLALAKSLAAEWAGYGIRVNTISPGYMDTLLNEGPGLTFTFRTWQERNPTGRIDPPEEATGC